MVFRMLDQDFSELDWLVFQRRDLNQNLNVIYFPCLIAQSKGDLQPPEIEHHIIAK